MDYLKRKRILLGEEHNILLVALARLLQDDFDVIGTATDGHELVRAAVKTKPDVIVSSIMMPSLNGIGILEKIRKQNLACKIIFLTSVTEGHIAKQAFSAGASGYILRDGTYEELKSAIHTVLRGNTYVSPEMAGPIVDAFRRPGRSKVALDGLTPREREVLQLVTEGKSAKEVAKVLNISPRTVEFHKYAMMSKLNLKTTSDLIRHAIRIGLIPG